MAQADEWVRQAGEGSAESFSRLVLAYQSRVRAYLWAYLRDRDVVEDLAQETFLQACRGLSGYRGESTVGVWLIGIARNLAALYLREKSSRGAREGEFASSALARWLTGRVESDAARLEESERRISALEACIERLPEQSARLVRAFYFERERGADLGRRAGKTEGALWMTLLRIRQALRRCIEGRLGTQSQGAEA